MYGLRAAVWTSSGHAEAILRHSNTAKMHQEVGGVLENECEIRLL
jgi:hypothetical protein